MTMGKTSKYDRNRKHKKYRNANRETLKRKAKDRYERKKKELTEEERNKKNARRRQLYHDRKQRQKNNTVDAHMEGKPKAWHTLNFGALVVEGIDVSGILEIAKATPDFGSKHKLFHTRRVDQGEYTPMTHRDAGFCLKYYRMKAPGENHTIDECLKWHPRITVAETGVPVDQMPKAPTILFDMAMHLLQYLPNGHLYVPCLAQFNYMDMDSTKHNGVHNGYKLGKHVDGKDQGDLVVSLNLDEKALFKLSYSQLKDEIVMRPGTAVFLECSCIHQFANEKFGKCLAEPRNKEVKFHCSRHYVSHSVETAHATDCKLCMKSKKVLTSYRNLGRIEGEQKKVSCVALLSQGESKSHSSMKQMDW